MKPLSKEIINTKTLEHAKHWFKSLLFIEKEWERVENIHILSQYLS